MTAYRWNFSRLGLATLLLLLLPFGFFVSTAQAQIDITGTWSYNIDVSGVPNNTQQWVLAQADTIITGTGSGNGFSWQINGTLVNGVMDVIVVYNEISYDQHFIFDVTQTSMVGTWSDSFGQNGGATGTPVILTGTIQTTTSLACVRGPAATDDFVCTATVTGNRAGQSPPSGTVQFVTQSGSFRNGNTCDLAEVSAGVSACGVTLIQPVGGFAAGHPVPVTADYPGDTHYLASFAEQAVTTITQLPAAPTVCLADADQACGGFSADVLEPQTVGNTLGILSFGYFAPVNGRSEGPYMPAAKVSAPRKPGEIAFQFRYVARLRDNPSLIGNRAIKGIANQLRNGIIVTDIKSKVDFGQRKDILAGLNSKGSKMMNTLRGASISQIKLSISLSVRRKVDRRSTSVASATNAHIN